MTDTWEIWDLAEEDSNENGLNNEFSPILSSREFSMDVSRNEAYKLKDNGINGSAATVASNIEVSISEDSGIVIPNKDYNGFSPTSPYMGRGRDSSRTNSLSESDDNIGLTNSYTLEEPGKEKRHVLVLSGTHRFGSSISPKNSRDRTSSMNSDYEKNASDGPRQRNGSKGGYHKNCFDAQHKNHRLNSSLDSIHRKHSSSSDGLKSRLNSETDLDRRKSVESMNFTNSVDSEHVKRGKELNGRSGLKKSKSANTLDTLLNRSKNFDRQHKKYNTNKSLSSSTSVINNVYSNTNKNNTQYRKGSTDTPTSQKKNKSIFAKAKQFFKSPLKKSSSVTELEKSIDVKTRHNNTYPNNGHRSSIDYCTSTNDGEEKHIIVVSPRERPLNASIYSDSSESSPETPGRKMSVKDISNSKAEVNERDISEKNHAATTSLSCKENAVEFTPTNSQSDEPAAALIGEESDNFSLHLNITDSGNIEDDYDIIDLVSPRKVNVDSKKTRSEKTVHDVPTDVKYDIVFKPEKPAGSHETKESNENTETSGITPLQEGLMSLVVGVGLGEIEETKHVVTAIQQPHSVEEHGTFQLNGERPTPATHPKPNIVSALALTGLSLGSVAVDKFSDDLLKSDLDNDKVEYSDVDESLDLSESDNRMPMTSTPIQTPVKRRVPPINLNKNDNNENKKVQGHITPDQYGEENVDTNEEYQAKVSSLKEQYGLRDVSKTGVHDDFSSSYYENSSVNSLNDQNTTDDYRDKLEIGNEQVSSMTNGSSNSFNSNKDVLLNHLSKLEIYEKIIQKGSEEDDISSKRKESTDSLASFECHERDFLNSSVNGSPVSPAFPSSPAMRSQRKVFHPTFANGSSLNGNSSGSDSVEDEDGNNDLTDEIAERRMTTELLKYMPPIDEGQEAVGVEGSQNNIAHITYKKDGDEGITKDRNGNIIFEIPLDSDQNPICADSDFSNSITLKDAIPTNNLKYSSTNLAKVESKDGINAKEEDVGGTLRQNRKGFDVKTDVRVQGNRAHQNVKGQVTRTTEIPIPKKCLWYNYSKEEIDPGNENKSHTDNDDPKSKDPIDSDQSINSTDNDACKKSHDLVTTQASFDSTDCDSGVEQDKRNSMALLEDEEEDSGTELRYDENFSHLIRHKYSDYEACLENIQPLLHNAELIANLFLRLANKYEKHRTEQNEILPTHHIHSAKITYDAIKESKTINFASVISYLLAYMGAIKSENPLPDDISIPNLLQFLEQLIKRNMLTSFHMNMFTCFLARPNGRLTAHHDLRLSFLKTCFQQELSQLNRYTDKSNYLHVCFMRICEYFVQWDMKLTEKLTKENIIPHLNDQNSTSFITNVLTYMGLIKTNDSVIITSDITPALLLLDVIFRLMKMSILTSQKLYASLQMNNQKFRFCTTERDELKKTLRQAYGF